MRVYRFGIPFKSRRELAHLLGLKAYTNKPISLASGPKEYVFLSEQDIINRMMRCSDASNENEAYDQFIQLVKNKYPDRFDSGDRGQNDDKQQDAYKAAGV